MKPIENIVVPPGAVEQEDKRTRFTKSWALDGTERFFAETQDPIHYADNGWYEVDLRPQQLGDAFYIDTVDYICNINVPDLEATIEHRSNGSRIVARLTHIDDVPVEQLPLNFSQAEATDKSARIVEVVPHLDLDFGFHGLRLHLNRIIKQGNGPHAFTWLITEDDNAVHEFAGFSRALSTTTMRRGRVEGSKTPVDTTTVPGKRIYEYRDEFLEQVQVSRRGNRTPIWIDADHTEYPVILETTIEDPISNRNDDIGEGVYRSEDTGLRSEPNDENYGNTYFRWWNDRWPILWGMQQMYSPFNNVQHNVGLRFLTVGVPQGAQINDASVRTLSFGGNEQAFRMLGIAQDHCDPWGNSPGNRPSDRVKTNSTGPRFEIPYNSPGWKTVNCTAPVQEIVNRGGWVTNNAMGLVGRGEMYYTTEPRRCWTWTHNYSGSHAGYEQGNGAVLQIRYEEVEPPEHGALTRVVERKRKSRVFGNVAIGR